MILSTATSVFGLLLIVGAFVSPLWLVIKMDVSFMEPRLILCNFYKCYDTTAKTTLSLTLNGGNLPTYLLISTVAVVITGLISQLFLIKKLKIGVVIGCLFNMASCAVWLWLGFSFYTQSLNSEKLMKGTVYSVWIGLASVLCYLLSHISALSAKVQ